MKAQLVLVGAGGHAKVAIETIRDEGRFEIAGLLDRDVTPRRVLGVPVIGDDTLLSSLPEAGIRHIFPALGDNERRVKLARKAREAGLELANAISPLAHLSPSAHVGRGVLLVAGAIVNADARINDLVIVNTKASVDHDCDIGAGAHLAPGSTLAGHASIGDRALIGMGAVVLPRVSVGAGTVVGAGACVNRDVPVGVTVVGVPARIILPRGA